METIKFRIIINNDMCRIVASDYRTVYRKIASGGCIGSLEVMLAEMQCIKNEIEKLGNETVFVID